MQLSLFFVLKAALIFLITFGDSFPQGEDIAIASTIAGLIVYILVRFVYWRKETRSVPSFFNVSGVQVVTYGLGLGIVAAFTGYLNLLVILRTKIFTADLEGSMNYFGTGAWWGVALMVVAVPVFEEFIFRGLLFAGLKKTWSLRRSVLASSLLFAIFHPPMFVIPSFLLGLMTALSYARTKALVVPVVVHGTYSFLMFMFSKNLLA